MALEESTINEYPKLVNELDRYSQGKFISEILVTRFAERQTSIQGFRHRNIRLIKPGIIVGTAGEGVANTDDFIWRLVAVTAGAGCFKGPEQDSRISLCGADQIAKLVVSETYLPSSVKMDDLVFKVIDGITVAEF